MIVSALIAALGADRLHDPSNAQWGSGELLDHINSALVRTLARTRTYVGIITTGLMEDQQTFSSNVSGGATGGSVWNILSVRFASTTLEKKQPSSMPVLNESWDLVPSGTPAMWTPTGAYSFRINPPANAAAVIASTMHLSIWGCLDIPTLDTDDDTYLYITDSRIEAILKAAEEECWNARPNMPNALAAAQLCHQMWIEECAQYRVDLGYPAQ